MSVIKTGKTWAFRTDIGKNPVTGKRKQVYRGGFLTKKEAELEWHLLLFAKFTMSYLNLCRRQLNGD
ncbi:Arm DNA-binding domain-containing protein [Neobacillus sp. PS3-12]|jgi:hypothetical protein|uniref:Arm DNA-binding domain-containing protein n=1 Tax=Neobacillus sp. PS3-12 TaxID=3070677 RepID=UPI0027DF8789|nr:Arm DNA-binding domain-containing protein [Neobacillus sp. PS3-12]WML51714.1 Arm DNA-binding domain-containing protein [Neobacillus sp. PS3-12]